MTNAIAFNANETIEIIGFIQDCECSHCGRALKVGVRVAGFGGAYGSDCLCKATAKQVVGPYIQKISAEGIRERAIIAGKGTEDRYGWRRGDANFRFTLKSPLQTI
jgi:hypothetical protein